MAICFSIDWNGNSPFITSKARKPKPEGAKFEFKDEMYFYDSEAEAIAGAIEGLEGCILSINDQSDPEVRRYKAQLENLKTLKAA